MSVYWFVLENKGKVATFRVKITLQPLYAEWFCSPGFFPIAHGRVFWNNHELGLYDMSDSNEPYPDPAAVRYARITLPPDSDGLDDIPLQSTGALNIGVSTGAWTLTDRKSD